MIVNELHKALSGAQRFLIVGMLLEGPKSRSTLLSVIECPTNLLSQDLRKLRISGLINYVKKGHENIYFLAQGVKYGKKSVQLNGQRVTYL